MSTSTSEVTDTRDVIVIGGGAAGENAAQYAIQGSDRTVVIVEAELVGGECSYWACMPSKALLRPIEVLGSARALPGVAEMFGGSLDVPAVLARRDSFTHDHDDSGQVEWARDARIDVVRGAARLVGEKLVELTTAGDIDRTLRARHAVVLATGSLPSIPPIDGLRAARPWTSRDVTNLREVPDRVAVIGGGVVACESTTWLRGLGATEVTIIEVERTLLSHLEPFAGALIAEQFSERGIGFTAVPRRSAPAARHSRWMRSSSPPDERRPWPASGWSISAWTRTPTATSTPTITWR